MIESIKIKDTSSFGSAPETLSGLAMFNYLYGSNGTGKTTVSRVIADEGAHPACGVKWKNGTKLETLVYNRDFVEKNFNQSSELKGVFTLGEKQVDALTKIATAKQEEDVIATKIAVFNLALHGEDGTSGKMAEIATLESKLKDKCWAQKQKHDGNFQGAFEGYRNSSDKFKAKIIAERATNSEALATLAELEKKAKTVFGPTPTVEKMVAVPESAKLLLHETDPILPKRVIGKEDVNIGAMIKRLGNSDWVRQGRGFYEANEGICPFCQQDTEEGFAQSLNEYFDETFTTDSKAIEDLATNYSTDAARYQQQIASIIAAPSKFLDIERLKEEKKLLDSKITVNLQRVATKKKEASQVVELDSLANVAEAIKKLVDGANTLVSEHNALVANLAKERTALTSQVWKFVLEELKTDLTDHVAARAALDKAVESISAKLVTAKAEKTKKAAEIRELEKQTTSIQPTIDGINGLLKHFGFQSFSLAKTTDDLSYKLVRSNGADAKATLSEGEKTFVTFLYFYHLLKGNTAASGMTADRVVVFDDPVSSLDSDILFVVGSLIKGVFEDVRNGVGHIKQVFVLTHNVYFHKEITFNPRRTNVAMTEETFWIVRKPGSESKVEKHTSNPIKTSYELLWSEVRRTDRSNLTIQNTLRRILENYFKILGDVDPDEICGMFEGKEKLICKSLFSWVNDGSHYAHDDLYLAIDDSAVTNYLNVFKAIFEKSKHLAHYKMMMGEP